MPIDDGFDFLGWNVRKYDGKLRIKPESVIRKLNPIIRGWANYHRNQVAKKTFSQVDHVIWKTLWQWACRRHPSKSAGWVRDRYFIAEGARNWVFGTKVRNKDGTERMLRRVKASDTPIRRHVKIKGDANSTLLNSKIR